MTLGRLEKRVDEDNSEVEFYKNLLRRNPEKYHLLDFLAYALFKQAEFVEAIHCWKKLLSKKVVKEEFRIYAKIAHAYELIGEIEQAYHYYGHAKDYNSKNMELIGKYGEMAYLIENYNDSLEAFKVVTKNEPLNAVAWHNLGLSYYNLGLIDNAIESIMISLEIEEESADTWYTLATVLAEDYQIDEALIALEKALTFQPELIDRVEDEQSFDSIADTSVFKLFFEMYKMV